MPPAPGRRRPGPGRCRDEPRRRPVPSVVRLERAWRRCSPTAWTGRSRSGTVSSAARRERAQPGPVATPAGPPQHRLRSGVPPRHPSPSGRSASPRCSPPPGVTGRCMAAVTRPWCSRSSPTGPCPRCPPRCAPGCGRNWAPGWSVCLLATVTDQAVAVRARALRPSYDPAHLTASLARAAAGALGEGTRPGAGPGAGPGPDWVVPQVRWLHEVDRLCPGRRRAPRPGPVRTNARLPPARPRGLAGRAGGPPAAGAAAASAVHGFRGEPAGRLDRAARRG